MRRPDAQAASRSNTEREKVQIERERLELEKRRAAFEQKFLNRNFAVIVTTLVSSTTALISASQLWLVKIQKDKEVELQRLQLEQQWNLESAKFIFEHPRQLFSDKAAERQVMREVIFAAFPKTATNLLVSQTKIAQRSLKRFHTLREFWEPDGKTKNQENEVKLRTWMTNNGLGVTSTTAFVSDAQFHIERMRAMRDLGLILTTEGQPVTDVSEDEVSSVVSDMYEMDDLVDVKMSQQANGSWQVTPIFGMRTHANTLANGAEVYSQD